MSGESARITDVEAVAQFTAAVRRFEDEASAALLALDQQVHRALHWLEHEAPAYWTQQIRRGYDEVARTRTALETCRMRKVADNRPACLEEEKAFRTAKRRLEIAQEKIEIVRRWAIHVHREVDEYRGRVGRLKQRLDGDVPKTIGLLERTLATLEGYLGRQIGTPDGAPEESDDTPSI